MDILKLLNFLFHESFKFDSDLLSNLNIVSVSDIVIMKNINVLNSLSLEVSVELFTPFVQESVPWLEKLISLFLGLKFSFQKFEF